MAYRRQQDRSRPQPLFSIRRIDEFWFDVPNEGAFVGPWLKPSDIEGQRTGTLLLFKEVIEATGTHTLFKYQLLAVDQGTVSVVGSTELDHVRVLATSAGGGSYSCTPKRLIKTDQGLHQETCLCHRSMNGTNIAPIFSHVVEMIQDRDNWRRSTDHRPDNVYIQSNNRGRFGALRPKDTP